MPHTHTANYRGIVIEGTAKHWTSDESKDEAPPVEAGGWWFQPAGQAHTDANVGDQPALALIMFDGPFDLVPAK